MGEVESNAYCTKSLRLVAATLGHVLAELEAPERLGLLLGVEVEPGWPPGEYDRAAQEFFRDRLQEGGAAVIGWYCWYAIRKEDRDRRPVLIGAGGYLGPPDENGEVEIGFSILPPWQGLGYATETAEFLIARAFSDTRVCKILAHTTSQNQASCKVLEKAGFKAGGIANESGIIRYEMIRNN